MLINNKYEIGQIVYLVTDTEQVKRMVLEIVITKGDLMYRLCFGTLTSTHYEFELSETKNELIGLT